MTPDPATSSVYDAIIVGGGPAGLAAALWLARYRRRVRVFDTGEPRNQPTWAVHAYPGLPDTPPYELRRRMREQALRAGAEYVRHEVTAIRGGKNEFSVELDGGEKLAARRIVLAYGVRDTLPDVPGIQEAYGISVFHCPDCDGPTALGKTVGVIGWDRAAARLALYLLTWCERTLLLSHGHELAMDDEALAVLSKNGVAVKRETLRRAVAPDGALTKVELEGGGALSLDMLFFHLGSHPSTDLADMLGCERDEQGYLETGEGQQTTVPGVYAAGDISGHPHLAINAAGDGVRAALAVHRSLLPAEFELRG